LASSSSSASSCSSAAHVREWTLLLFNKFFSPSLILRATKYLLNKGKRLVQYINKGERTNKRKFNPMIFQLKKVWGSARSDPSSLLLLPSLSLRFV